MKIYNLINNRLNLDNGVELRSLFNKQKKI